MGACQDPCWGCRVDRSVFVDMGGDEGEEREKEEKEKKEERGEEEKKQEEEQNNERRYNGEGACLAVPCLDSIPNTPYDFHNMVRSDP